MDEKSSGGAEANALLFIQLVAMLQMAAMQHMGKIVNPVTGKVERDLEQAKVSIDMLEMIKEKTKGNLEKNEVDFLDKILFELHMNYVDEVGKPKEPAGQKKEADTAESASERKSRPEGSKEEPPKRASKTKSKKKADSKEKGC